MLRPGHCCLSLLTLAVVSSWLAAATRGGAMRELLPPNADAALALNIRKLMETPPLRQVFALPGVTDYWQLASRNHSHDRNLEGLVPPLEVLQFLQAVDIDVFKDIERLTIAGRAGGDFSTWPLILEGAFDSSHIKARISALAAENPECLRIGGQRDFEIWQWYSSYSSAPSPSLHVALLGPRTLIMASSKKTIHDLIERALRQVTPNSSFGALLERAGPKQIVTLVASPNVVTEILERQAPADCARLNWKQITSDVSALSLGLLFENKNLQLEIMFNTKSPQAAIMLRGSLVRRKLGGMLVLNARDARNNRAAVNFIRGLRVTRQGPALTIRGTLPNNTIGRLWKAAASVQDAVRFP